MTTGRAEPTNIDEYIAGFAPEVQVTAAREAKPREGRRKEQGGALTMTVRPVVLEVRVKPSSRSSTLEQGVDGRWLAHVKAAPVDGKANEELIALVASRFGRRKSAVSIKSGASGRVKFVRIDVS